MLTARDSCVVLGTALALLAYQNGATYYARWKGERARQQNPLIPSQIATTDDQMDTWCVCAVPTLVVAVSCSWFLDVKIIINTW